MKTVLITGGSEGIGYALAECFAEDHYRILLAARNIEKLNQASKKLQNTYHAETAVYSIDLSALGNAEQLYRQIREDGYQVDVLVNNAGIGFLGRSWEIPIEADERLTILNDTSLMTLTKLALKDMLASGKGEIINISSTGAFQPGPYIASYYASKVFIEYYTRAAAEEVKHTGVRVYCYCPGPVDTAFYPKSGGKKPFGAMSAEQAAEYVYKHRGSRCMIIPGFLNQITRIVPTDLRMKAILLMKKKTL